MIEIRQARYFVAVAEELHFGRAADRLHMSQPPLSQAIRQLERQVGARLLDRTKRSVALTPAGEAFLEGCRSLLREADEVTGIPKLVTTGRGGRLRIGAVASAFEHPLPDILARLRERHPDLEILAEEIDSHEANRALLDRRLDAAVVRQAAPQRGIRSTPLLADEFVAALPAAHPLATAPSALDLAELATEPWVWLPRQISPDYHDAMAAACRRAGFSPIATHWARSITSQLALVSCGLGVTIVPAAAMNAGPPRVIARPLLDMARSVGLAVATRDDAEPVTTAFVECAESATQ
jgi:DNA-binding transcriptional LysR family regulator